MTTVIFPVMVAVIVAVTIDNIDGLVRIHEMAKIVRIAKIFFGNSNQSGSGQK